jgi:hypothetical protein
VREERRCVVCVFEEDEDEEAGWLAGLVNNTFRGQAV